MRPCGTYSDSYAKDMVVVQTRLQWILLAIFVVFLIAMPSFISPHLVSWLILIGITIITVHGLNILTGYSGQISIGQAAFVGVGSYAYAILMLRLGLPFWVALPCSAIITGIIGLFFGLPAVKIKGFYLLITTLAAQFILAWVFRHWTSMTGGFLYGLHVPEAAIGSFVFDTDIKKYYLVFALVALMTYMAKNLSRTGVGRAFIAIRDNDLAASVMGVDLARYKLLAFFLCSLYAGVAGSLWAMYVTHLNPDMYLLMDSIWYLGMLIIGGMGSTVGAIFGVVFLRGLGELVTVFSPNLNNLFPALSVGMSAALGHLTFAVAIILFLIFEPRGLSHRWELVKASYRLHPFAY